MAGKIFVNYRRGDTRDAAARLRDKLAGTLGDTNVFMDVDNLRPGERFDLKLQEALAGTDVFLAVIGPRWMELLEARSVSGEHDFVREEIAAALAAKLIVIPVLMDHAPLPKAVSLPGDIRELVFYQKHDIMYESFGRDVATLVEAVETQRREREKQAAEAAQCELEQQRQEIEAARLKREKEMAEAKRLSQEKKQAEVEARRREREIARAARREHPGLPWKPIAAALGVTAAMALIIFVVVFRLEATHNSRKFIKIATEENFAKARWRSGDRAVSAGVPFEAVPGISKVELTDPDLWILSAAPWPTTEKEISVNYTTLSENENVLKTVLERRSVHIVQSAALLRAEKSGACPTVMPDPAGHGLAIWADADLYREEYLEDLVDAKVAFKTDISYYTRPDAQRVFVKLRDKDICGWLDRINLLTSDVAISVSEYDKACSEPVGSGIGHSPNPLGVKAIIRSSPLRYTEQGKLGSFNPVLTPIFRRPYANGTSANSVRDLKLADAHISTIYFVYKCLSLPGGGGNRPRRWLYLAGMNAFKTAPLAGWVDESDVFLWETQISVFYNTKSDATPFDVYSTILGARDADPKKLIAQRPPRGAINIPDNRNFPRYPVLNSRDTGLDISPNGDGPERAMRIAYFGQSCGDCTDTLPDAIPTGPLPGITAAKPEAFGALPTLLTMNSALRAQGKSLEEAELLYRSKFITMDGWLRYKIGDDSFDHWFSTTPLGLRELRNTTGRLCSALSTANVLEPMRSALRQSVEAVSGDTIGPEETISSILERTYHFPKELYVPLFQIKLDDFAAWWEGMPINGRMGATHNVRKEFRYQVCKSVPLLDFVLNGERIDPDTDLERDDNLTGAWKLKKGVRPKSFDWLWRQENGIELYYLPISFLPGGGK